MIESKETLVANFLRLAADYEQVQNPVTGIDLDDAIVRLRRYILTHEKDEALARDLYDLGKLIRKLDMPTYSTLLARIRDALA